MKPITHFTTFYFRTRSELFSLAYPLFSRTVNDSVPSFPQRIPEHAGCSVRAFSGRPSRSSPRSPDQEAVRKESLHRAFASVAIGE